MAAATQDAFISGHQINQEWLLKRGKTQHSYYKANAFMCEAVQEMALSGLKIGQRHILLKKKSGEDCFNLPAGYTGWSAVGIRRGGTWIPVAVSDRLMPYEPTAGTTGEFNGTQFGEQFATSGPLVSWQQHDHPNTPEGAFSGQYFDNATIDTNAATTTPVTAPCYSYCNEGFMPFGMWGWGWNNINTWGEYTSYEYVNRPTVWINEQQGKIMCSRSFPGNELYLEYVAVGLSLMDGGCFIPIMYQQAIETYMDWCWASRKRNADKSAVAIAYNSWLTQRKIAVARQDPFNLTSFKRVLNREYWRDECYGGGAPCEVPAIVTGGGNSGTSTSFLASLTLTATTTGSTIEVEAGATHTVTSMMINGVGKNTGFTQSTTTITFTDGADFYAGDVITFYFKQ